MAGDNMSEADGGNRQVMEAVYDPLLARPPRDFHNRRQLPKNGINVFYERDELAAGTSPERVTRVGMNTAQGRFPTRIRQHYGRVRGLGGNKNGSVFRKHVGGTPLRRHDPDDARLDPWLATRGGSYPEVEEAVSQFLRGRFTFRCFTVNDTKERLR